MSKAVKKECVSKISWYCVDDKGRGVSTFIPRVLRKIELKFETRTEKFLWLELIFFNGEKAESTVLLSEIERINWGDIDERCIINSSYRNAKGFIANLVRASLTTAPLEEKYGMEHLGIHFVDKKVVFVAGDRVITRSCDNQLISRIKLSNIPFRLDIDLKLSKEETFEGMRELISISPELGRVLVAHVISGITRVAFKKGGLTPCAVLVVVGESGLLKSHYVPHLVQLYNRSDEVKADTRFNSTKRYLEDVLCECSECTVVVDDLHSAESKSIKRTNEETAEEIIRRISDDTGRGHKEGNASVQKKFNGNVVYIGEHIIGKESTIPRALVVQLTKRPNGKILDKYQRKQPLLVSTFYFFFIQWYVECFEEICNMIEVRLTKFREITADTEFHGRLCDTRFYLQIAYMLFLEFCRQSNFISEQDALDEYCSFETQLTSLIQAQQERFRPRKSELKEMDYVNIIRTIYKKKKLRLADNVESFNVDKHDAVIHYECLCVRRKNLEDILSKFLPSVPIDYVIQGLEKKHALKRVKDKRTVKISTLNKEAGSLRFYAIWLHMLE